MKKGFVFLETIIVLTVVTLSLTILLSSYTLIKTKAKERENYDRVSDKYMLYTFSNLGTNATYNYKEIAKNGYLKLNPKTCTNYQPVQLKEENFNTVSDNFGTATVFEITAHGVQTIDPTVDCSSNSNKNNISCMFFHIFDKEKTKVDIDSSASASEITASACETVMNKLNLKYIYVIPNIQEALKSEFATTIFDAGTLNYIKTLKKCNDKNKFTTTDEERNTFVSDKNNENTCEDYIEYLVGVFVRNNEYFFASIEL